MKGKFDRSRAVWRKSTLSTDSGACVEFASQHGTIGIRDSKDPAGPVLLFTPAEWIAFLGGAKNGEFEI